MEDEYVWYSGILPSLFQFSTAVRGTVPPPPSVPPLPLTVELSTATPADTLAYIATEVCFIYKTNLCASDGQYNTKYMCLSYIQKGLRSFLVAKEGWWDIR